MRKVLVLTLVLAIASIASATLQISVNGEQNPVDSEIWLAPSEHLVLDIWTDSDILPGGGEEGYFALVVSDLEGHISGGTNVSGEPSVYIYDYSASMPGGNGIWSSIVLGTAPSVLAGGTILDLIDFHCEAEGDALIELIYGGIGFPVYGVSPVVDSVIIHQVPEPMTMALLGLGGLFLRRRKK